MSLAPEYKKLTGVAHFLAAATYSAGGLSRAWKEAAFRQEVAAGCGLALVYFWVGVDLATALTATILFLLLIAVEALNTAVEEIVDRISPEIPKRAGMPRTSVPLPYFASSSPTRFCCFMSWAGH